MYSSKSKSDFIVTNGVKLHYLDWGGDGPTLLFIPGLGCNAHIFDQFAPRFINEYRVVAFTRRGHGISDHPESGYDIETLTRDLLGFMDALKIDKVILAGHSMAGCELSHFAVLYPDRVTALVYLDAAYDRSSQSFKNMVAKNPLRLFQVPGQGKDHYSVEEFFQSVRYDYPSLAAIWGEAMQAQGMDEITIAPDGKVVETQSEAIGAACMETLRTYVPEDAQVKAPSLGVFATDNCNLYLAEWMTEDQKAQVRSHFKETNDPWQEENIQAFKRNFTQGKLVVIPQGHHYCFIMKADIVYNEMAKFLRGVV
jgi:non-heme chloroperoxidase